MCHFADGRAPVAHLLMSLQESVQGQGETEQSLGNAPGREPMSEGFQRVIVPRLTSHMHSGAPLAVHPNHTCGVLLMLLPVFDSTPCNKTTIQLTALGVVLLPGMLSRTGKRRHRCGLGGPPVVRHCACGRSVLAQLFIESLHNSHKVLSTPLHLCPVYAKQAAEQAALMLMTADCSASAAVNKLTQVNKPLFVETHCRAHTHC